MNRTAETLRPHLHEIGSKWIRTKTVRDRPCVYTGLGGSEPIWICYTKISWLYVPKPDHFRERSRLDTIPKSSRATGGIGSKLVYTDRK